MFMFEDARFDGHSVIGRALVGPLEGTLVVNEAPPESHRFYYGPKVVRCGTGEPLESLHRMPEGCLDPSNCGPSQKLTGGYYWARDIHLDILQQPKLCIQPGTVDILGPCPGTGSMDTEQNGGPACIEFDLMFGPLTGPPLAQLHVRAHRHGVVEVTEVMTCGLLDAKGNKLYTPW